MRSGPLALALLVLLGGCGHVLPGAVTGDGKDFDFARDLPCEPPAADDTKVEVRYLGSGGVYIRWRGDAILVGPSFSNPSLWRAAAWHGKADPVRVNAALDRLALDRVRAILVGHSHYDHIGDLPEVGERVGGPIYVNLLGWRMLQAVEGLAGRAIVIPDKPFEPAPSMRVRAVRSGHAPQVCPWFQRWPCVYGGGDVPEPWEKGSWRRHLLMTFGGGEPNAFVIELLDADRVPRYRIYYNDAAAASPLGQVQEEIDLAILCIAQWSWVRDYPRDLLNVMRPRHVMVSHWDDFFGHEKTGATFVPFLTSGSAAAFLTVVNARVPAGAGPVNEVCGARNVGWTMPIVGEAMMFVPRPPPPAETSHEDRTPARRLERRGGGHS